MCAQDCLIISEYTHGLKKTGRRKNLLLVFLMCIFFPGGKSASDVAFRFVYVQHCPCLFGKRRVNLHKPGGDIFMYSRFTYPKCFGGLPHSGVIFDDIDSNIDRSFFNIIFHILKRVLLLSHLYIL